MGRERLWLVTICREIGWVSMSFRREGAMVAFGASHRRAVVRLVRDAARA